MVTWRPLHGIELDVTVSAAWRLDRSTPALRKLVGLLVGDDRLDAGGRP
jgi:hypothetical protein